MIKTILSCQEDYTAVVFATVSASSISYHVALIVFVGAMTPSALHWLVKFFET